jgi:hypothetical protein
VHVDSKPRSGERQRWQTPGSRVMWYESAFASVNARPNFSCAKRVASSALLRFNDAKALVCSSVSEEGHSTSTPHLGQ